MDVSMPMMIIVAAAFLAVGGYLAVSLVLAVRQKDRMPALVKALSSILVAGGVGALLALGGSILAALLGAATVAIWFARVFTVGAGVVALSVLGLVTLAIWRRVVKRHTPAR